MKQIVNTEEDFKKLLKKGKYQVFVMSSRIPFPLNFAVHTWFVGVDKNNKTRRIDWGTFRTEEGVLHINLGKPWQGISKSWMNPKSSFSVKVSDYFEGGKNSEAHKLFEFLQKDFKEYPYEEKYVVWPGPNSNTFPMWVSKNIGIKIKLPWNAFGKHYGWWKR